MRWTRLITRSSKDAEPNEFLRLVSQDVPRDAELGLKLVDSANAAETVSKNQKTPAIADDCNGPRDRAVFLLKRVPSHPSSSLEL